MLDEEERAKGKGFMDRVKKRWDREFPDVMHTAKNLTANARIFRRQRAQDTHDEAAREKQNAYWTTAMKTRLVELERQARKEGRGFMARLKMRWDEEFTDFQHLDAQCLRDNASRFAKETAISNVMLVRERRDEAEIDMDGVITEQNETAGEVMEQVEMEIERAMTVNELRPEDEQLQNVFFEELEKLVQVDERKRIGEVKLPQEMKERANRILCMHFQTHASFEEITDAVYAMGCAIRKCLDCKNTKASPPKENRRIVKYRKQLKELRQKVARVSNEIHRRKTNRKLTLRERDIMKKMRKQAGSKLDNEHQLRITKEKWLDQMRAKRVNLQKTMQRERRIKDNRSFVRKEGKFYQALGGDTEHTGQVPPMERFTEFWGGIWEDEEKTEYQPWMKVIEDKIRAKVHDVDEFKVTEAGIKRVIGKRKNWTAPGIDGIENFWWKTFKASWRPLCAAMNHWVEDQASIPQWLTLGRTVLLPKTKDLTSEKDYRPITCLNTSYKIFTGVLGDYMKEHAEKNDLWDKNQMGTCSGVLGTVDQLLIDNCIMDEVRNNKRNLAVAYYDYQKAYDKVHHDWMTTVYRWMGFPDRVIQVVEHLMKGWRTKLEVMARGTRETSRWIEIKRGFLQGDSFSPVGFCLTEVPVAMLIEESDGYMMGPPGKRNLKRTHSLFIDDLKVYQQSHEKLKAVNETIVKASRDTGACYGVKKCAEIVFLRGKMVHADGLEVLNERMKALDPEKNEHYKFLGCEQAEQIDMEAVYERVRTEMAKRLQLLTSTELYERNMIKAINTRVIPVASYVMNVCQFNRKQLDELDKVVKKELRDKNMHGRQASDERLYLRREDGGRGLKSMKDVYEETKIRVACYMAYQESPWIQAAWDCEVRKDGKSMTRDVNNIIKEYCANMELKRDGIYEDGSKIFGTWRDIWTKVKGMVREGRRQRRKESYLEKRMQSEYYKYLDEDCHQWLSCNIDPRKVSSIISMQEQMVETKAWKRNRGIAVENDKCRLCGQCAEGVMHLISGCRCLAAREYLTRHNNVLKILMTAWCKENELMKDDEPWYKVKWSQGEVIENEDVKMTWDFEYQMRKESTARRPDVTIEYKEQKRIQLVDMACPSEKNVNEKMNEKRQKYQQLAFEIRERRPGYKVEIVPVVIGCMGGGAGVMKAQVRKILISSNVEQTCREMLRTTVMESESIVRKVISNIVTTD